MLELQAGGERRLGDLELLRGRLGGGEPVLQLVAGPRERARERLVRVARHPAEELGRGRDRAELSRGAGRAPQVLRRLGGQRAADRRARDERAEQVRAAALVLPGAALAVLVAADRDVLGAVVGGKLATAQREHGRRKREHPADELGRERAQARRVLDRPHDERRAAHRREHLRALKRQPCLRQPAVHLRQQREDLGDARRPTQERVLDLGRPEALVLRGHLQLAVLAAHRARPRIRAVHEHAVHERHPAEPDLLVHREKPSRRQSPRRRRAGSSRRRARGRRSRRARSPSGSTGRPAAGPSSSSGRSRTRPSRRPRAASGCR